MAAKAIWAPSVAAGVAGLLTTTAERLEGMTNTAADALNAPWLQSLPGPVG